MNSPKSVFKPKSVPSEGAAKALGFAEQMKELKKDILNLTISTDNDIRPLKRRMDAAMEMISAIVEMLGPAEVGKKLDERRIQKLQAQDQSREQHIAQMLEQKRIEPEEVVRGAVANDMGSFIVTVEYGPGNPEDPMPGTLTFMPMGAGSPPEIINQFVGQKVGFEVLLPNLDPETKQTAKDSEGNEIAPGRIILLGIYKALPIPEEPAATATATTPVPPPAPTPEAVAEQAPEVTA